MSLICQNIRNQVSSFAAWVGRSPIIANGVTTLTRRAAELSWRAKVYYFDCPQETKDRIQNTAEVINYLLRFTTFISIFQYDPFSLQTLGGAAALYAANRIQREITKMNVPLFRKPTPESFTHQVEALRKIAYNNPQEGRKLAFAIGVLLRAFNSWNRPEDLSASHDLLRQIYAVVYGDKDKEILNKFWEKHDIPYEVDQFIIRSGADPEAYAAMEEEIAALAEENERINAAKPDPEVRTLHDVAALIAKGDIERDKFEFHQTVQLEKNGNVLLPPKGTIAYCKARGMKVIKPEDLPPSRR